MGKDTGLVEMSAQMVVKCRAKLQKRCSRKKQRTRETQKQAGNGNASDRGIQRLQACKSIHVSYDTRAMSGAEGLETSELDARCGSVGD